jgi:hypothetical protein
LTEEFDALVDLNVGFTTYVRGFEFVVGHDDSELNLCFSKGECDFDTFLKISHSGYGFSDSF